MLLINQLLNEQQISEISNLLKMVPSQDGRSTAGYAGRQIKHNLQYDEQHPKYQQADAIVRKAMFACEEYQGYAFPNRMGLIRFAQYGESMTYGEHVDAAIMVFRGIIVRADLSFTVFLSEPDEYDGGELVIKFMETEHRVKAARGDMFVYPSGYRHQVEPVTRGVRKVAVGWIQSLYRLPEQRQILTDLQAAAYEVMDKHGKTETFRQINESFLALERLWVDSA